jgi:hypothetical protein
VALPEKEAAVTVLRMCEGYNDAEKSLERPLPSSSTGWTSNRAKFFAYGQLSDGAAREDRTAFIRRLGGALFLA